MHSSSRKIGGKPSPLLWNPSKGLALFCAVANFFAMFFAVILLYFSLAEKSVCGNYAYVLHSSVLIANLLGCIAWGNAGTDYLSSDEEWSSRLLIIMGSLIFSAIPAFFSFKWYLDLFRDTFEVEDGFDPFSAIPMRLCLEADKIRTIFCLIECFFTLIRVFYETAFFYLIYLRGLIRQMRYLSQMA